LLANDTLLLELGKAEDMLKKQNELTNDKIRVAEEMLKEK